MSLDYPNRAEWLAKRNNTVAGKVRYGRMFWNSSGKGTLRAGRTKTKVRIWDARCLRRILKKAAKRQS